MNFLNFGNLKILKLKIIFKKRNKKLFNLEILKIIFLEKN